MKNPQNIQVVEPKATYLVPTFGVENTGLIDGPEVEVRFCKGNKEDPTSLRQVGFFTETLIATCVQYLRDNNVGDLASRETSEAITCIETGLLWLGKRAADRKAREVQGTYQK
jgi:hypothetical protein